MVLPVGGLITVEAKGSLASLLLYALHSSGTLRMEFGLTKWQNIFMSAVPYAWNELFRNVIGDRFSFAAAEKLLQRRGKVAEAAVLEAIFGYLLRS